MSDDSLPHDVVARLHAIADAYLNVRDPIRQSGFSGGPARWRSEREPILDTVPCSGSFIDVGCANGHLLECLVARERERGIELYPFGVDISAPLVALAQQRLAHWADRFFVGNAWDALLVAPSRCSLPVARFTWLADT
jgi:SAM-dependent methyltransferase